MEINEVLNMLEENKADYDYVKSMLETKYGANIDRVLWEHSRQLTLLALRIKFRRLKEGASNSSKENKNGN